MQTINCIFKFSLFRTKTDAFMINAPILQSRLRATWSRHPWLYFLEHIQNKIKYGTYLLSSNEICSYLCRGILAFWIDTPRRFDRWAVSTKPKMEKTRSLGVESTGTANHFRATLVLSGPGHPNSRGLFLDPCRPRYVSTGFFCQKIKKIDHLFNLPTSLENLLGIY